MPSSGRILIVDDHPLTREGLSLAVRAAVPGAATHGVGSTAEAAAVLGQWTSCRMILLDFMLPDSYGFTAFLALQQIVPNARIVVISAREDAALVEAAKALGASGFLFKSRPLDEIAAQLKRVDDGKIVFPAQFADSRDVAGARDRIDSLSPAQRSVLIALADGRSNKQIAYDLSVTEATIKAHLTAIFRKLGVTNRAQALLAIQPLLHVGADHAGR